MKKQIPWGDTGKKTWVNLPEGKDWQVVTSSARAQLFTADKSKSLNLRRCNACQWAKLEAEFYSKYGNCKGCHIKTVRKWQKENPKKMVKYAAKYFGRRDRDMGRDTAIYNANGVPPHQNPEQG